MAGVRGFKLWATGAGALSLPVTGLALLLISGVQADTFQDWIAGFAKSDIRFQRSTSNVPFVPLGFVDISHYGDTELHAPGGSGRSAPFDQIVISQGATLPFLVSRRDAVLVGEWLSWSGFDTRSTGSDSFSVVSVGVPVGWLRQVKADWHEVSLRAPVGTA